MAHMNRSGRGRLVCCLVLLVLAAALGGCSGMGGAARGAYGFIEASRPEAPGELQLDVQGTLVRVTLDFPQGYAKGKLFPLLLVLNPEPGHTLPDLPRAAYDSGFLIATPQTLPQNPAAIQAFIAALDGLLETLRQDYAVDPRRICILGRGTGADLAQVVTCARSHRVAGLALVQGGDAPANCRPVKPIPTIILTDTQGGGNAATFWAHKNGCDPLPQQGNRNGVQRESYQCPAASNAVQRYSVTPQGDVEPFAAFPAAFTVMEFLQRRTAP